MHGITGRARGRIDGRPRPARGPARRRTTRARWTPRSPAEEARSDRADRSPERLALLSTRIGYGGSRGGARARASCAAARPNAAVLADGTRTACCTRTRRTRADPETTSAPARTTAAANRSSLAATAAAERNRARCAPPPPETRRIPPIGEPPTFVAAALR